MTSPVRNRKEACLKCALLISNKGNTGKCTKYAINIPRKVFCSTGVYNKCRHFTKK